MNNLINETNAREIITFLKKEVKQDYFNSKTQATYNRKVLNLEREKRREVITHLQFIEKTKALTEWYTEAEKLMKPTVLGLDTTTLIIIYNKLRRGDRRPHLGSVERDNTYLENNMGYNRAIKYIATTFPKKEEVKEVC